jgi:hypothetical protein
MTIQTGNDWGLITISELCFGRHGGCTPLVLTKCTFCTHDATCLVDRRTNYESAKNLANIIRTVS